MSYVNESSVQDQEKKPNFIRLEFSKKQVDFDHPKHNENNGKDYVRILAPERGS